MFVSRRVPISRARTLSCPRNRGNFMRTAITLLELVIGSAFTIAVAAYVAQGALLMAQFAL
jgi:hypothetical protein